MKRASDSLRLAAMGAILLAALIRAMTGECGTPYWDLDPLLTSVPETTLLPSRGLALDALVWLAVGAALLGEMLAGRRVMWRSGVLVGLGALGVLLHGLVLAPLGAPDLRADFDSLVRGSAWAAAMAGAWAMAHLARDPELRRAAGLTLLGFVVLLAAVGAYQYFLEHAITVREFDADPRAALAAQGMEPGTVAASVFERRLRQPEAMGWFGLANVYGSFAAAALAGWLALALATRRARRKGWAWACAGACALSAAPLAMSGSKGAAGAAALGVGLVVVSSIAPLRDLLRRAGWLLALAVVALPWAGVAARGAIGERIGELSLLFRAQYATAAMRIVADHPLLGVGPAGFKIAYATAKVPTNPEWVDSSHSLMLDWGAALGLLAVPWILAWLWWVCSAGRGLADTTDDGFDAPRTTRARPVALLGVLLAILLAWRLDMPTTLQGEMALRAIASLVWIALLLAPIPVTRAALGAAALTLAAHMQIEMTGVRTSSALAAMLLIGLAAAPCGTPQPAASKVHRGGAGLGATLAALLALTVAFAGALPAWRWESHLRQAAHVANESSMLTPDEMIAGFAQSRAQLERADGIFPSTKEPLLQAARLTMVCAQTMATLAARDDAATAAGQAVAIAQRAAERFSNDSVVWSRLALLRAMTHDITHDPADLEAAADAWEHAAVLDPFALVPAVQAWKLNAALGRADRAREWARRALRNDEMLHLDPLVRLSESTREQLERFARSGADASRSSPPNGTP